MFTDPSILDTIASVASALLQDEGAGGSAPPAASEVAEGGLGESAVGMDSVVIASPPTPAREGTGASLPQPAEAVTTAPAASVVGTVEGVVRGAVPSSPHPVAATVEEVPVLSQPAAAPQEHDTTEGVTRATSLKI
jgi:hypothetical protein